MTKTILLSNSEFDELRDNATAWNPLIAVCDSELTAEAVPAVEFAPDQSYSSAGHTTTELSDRLSIPASIAYRAALCYRLTGETKYATHAQNLIDSWYRTLRRVYGLNGQGIIGFHFLYFIVAADWVRDVNGWNGEAFGEFLNEIILPNSRWDYKNNIAIWWSALEAGIHAYNDNYKGLIEAKKHWQLQMIDQICISDVSGSPCRLSFASDMTFEQKQWTLPEEVTRSGTSNFNGGEDKGVRGISYTHFSFLPATLCAEILLKEGIDLYATDEARYFQNCFNKTVGWVKDPVTFPYYARNSGQLDNVRQCSYFAALVKRFTADEAGDATALTDAQAILDGGIQGDRWQLDLLYRGNWNAPS